MKNLILNLITLTLIFSNLGANTDIRDEVEKLDKPLYKPFIERYLLDETKSLRNEQQTIKAEVSEKIAKAQLDMSDRAMNYMTSTVSNIFLIFAAIGSIGAFIGWKNVRDAKEQTKVIVQQKLEEITKEYTEKLAKIETEMQKKSEEILTNQENITRSNNIHALWRRSNLEDNLEAKIEIYDQILSLDPKNVEALAYKADSVLEIGQKEWALNLCNKALDIDSNYAYSYWQRSCANAEMGNIESAIKDISKAIKISPAFAKDIDGEPSFDSIREHETFLAFIKNELPTLMKKS